MKRTEQIIALLKQYPGGLYAKDLAQRIGIPPSSLSTYLSAARAYLRETDSGETIAYRDFRGGDPVRLVPNYDPRAKAPVAQQRRQAETRQEEIGAQYNRLGSGLMARGLIAEANIAFAYAGQALFHKTQLSKLDSQFKEIAGELLAA